MNVRAFQGIKPTIDDSAYIDPLAAIIGDVTIGQDVSVWPFCSVRGDVNHISIGDRTNIQDNSVLHVTHKNKENPAGVPLIIGDDVTVGHQVMLHACTIENESLIGMSSIILDGAYIEKHVLLGAGSLVPPGMKLESGYLYLGRPAKRIRVLSDKEVGHFLYSANHYVTLKNQYK